MLVLQVLGKQRAIFASEQLQEVAGLSGPGIQVVLALAAEQVVVVGAGEEIVVVAGETLAGAAIAPELIVTGHAVEHVAAEAAVEPVTGSRAT